MADSLTFLVIVAGLAGKGMLSGDDPQTLEAHLLQHFPVETNTRVIVFKTIHFSPGDNPPIAPSLNESALQLLQVLQAQKHKEQKQEREEISTRTDQFVIKDEEHVISSTASEKAATGLKVAFLAHDIGGFVVKQALLLANSERCFEWIATGTVAALFFGMPHNVPENTRWDSVIVKMLAELEQIPDILSFLNRFPQFVAQLQSDFEVLLGSYHMVNFTANGHRGSSVISHVAPQQPIYSCDQHVVLDCDPDQMWDVGDNRPWSDTICEVLRFHLDLNATGADEIRRRLTLSLARLHPELHQLGDVTRASAPPITGTWIPRNCFDEHITTSKESSCHIIGPHGAGKSFLVSKIVNNLRTGNHLVLSYAVGEESNQSVSTVDLFRSFCQQALLSPLTLHHAIQVSSWLMGGALFTYDAFKGLLCSILSSYTGDTVVCIIDGIDNYSPDVRRKLCTDLQQVRDAFQSTLRSDESQSRLRIVLTWSNEDKKCPLMDSGHIINVGKEIEDSFELKRLAEAHFKKLTVAEPVWGTIPPEAITKVWEGSRSLFELTEKLEFLTGAAPSTPQEADKEVRTIPETFPLFFSYMERSRHLVDQPSVFWIAHAVRPMTVSELAVCVAVDGLTSPNSLTAKKPLTAQELKKTIPWNLRKRLETNLGLIVRITGETVHVNHRLTEEQIHLTASWSRTNGHLRVLSGCLDYLKAISVTWNGTQEFDKENRFAQYAALHWPDHYRRAVSPPKGKPRASDKDKDEASRSVLSFLQEAAYFSVWLNMLSYYTKVVPGRRRRLPETPAQVASYFGLTKILETLLTDIDNIDKLGREFEIALDLAADHGHVEIVRLLVGRGVRSDSALVRAARSGDTTTMTELLKTHKDYINSRAGKDGVYTPLLQTVRCGHLDSFSLLQGAGADLIATTPKTDLSAAHLASRIGHENIMRLLLRENIPLENTDQRGYTALAYAAEAGFSSIVRILVEPEPPNTSPESTLGGGKKFINTQTSTLDSPLHLAASNGHRKTVQVLLKHGADLWLTNEDQYTPLHCAAKGGFNGILEDILKAMEKAPSRNVDCAVSAQSANKSGRVASPLELAAMSGQRDALITLHNHRALIDASKETLSLALKAACIHSNGDCILYVLQWRQGGNKPEGPLRFEFGDTIFHLLARRGDAQLFRSVWSEMIIGTAYGPDRSVAADNENGRTPLHEAASSGRLSIVQQLSETLPRSAFQEATSDRLRRTPLQLAAEAGHGAIVNWLLENSSHLSESKEAAGEEQAVMLAAHKGHEKIVGTLLPSAFATVSGKLLHLIVEKGWEKLVEKALRKKASVVNWQDPTSNNRTALHIAVQKGDVQIIKSLLKYEADANRRDDQGKSPFALAMEASNHDINLKLVKTLLDGDPGEKILVDQPDDEGVTPLLRACAECQSNKGKLDVIRQLLETRKCDVDLNATYPRLYYSEHAGKGPLHLAALMLDRNQEGSDALLNLLLEHGADPNVKHSRGSTPLFLAAETGHLKAVRKLLNSRADPKAANNGGSTPLHRAAQNGHAECIEELVKHGADLNATKNIDEDGVWGITPLVLAVSQSHVDAVKTMLDLNATVGRAFHFAGSVGIAQALLNKYGHERMQELDKDLGTPLHSAVMSDDEDLVNLFSSEGVDVNATDGAGRTPLIIAAKRDCEGFVKTFLAKDADANKRDHEGKTALDHAIIQGNSEITTLLCNYPSLDLTTAAVRNHSPLYLAARMSSDGIFETVSAACMDLGDTQYVHLCELALHAAIASDKEDRLDQLLNVKGVTALCEDDDGWTPLYCAMQYDRRNMEKTLRQKLDENVGDADRNVEQKMNNQRAVEPTVWHFTDRHPCLHQSQDVEEQVVSVTTTLPSTDIGGEDSTAVVRADHCIPRDRDYYFEVTIVKEYTSGEQYLGIGLIDDLASLHRMIGFSGTAFGYHADDGSTYSTQSWHKNLHSLAEVYGEGDTVGCGFDASTKRVYFTKEGIELAEDYDDVWGKLYPAVFFSTREADVKISTMFPKHGTDGFKYKWPRDTAEKEDTDQMQSSDSSNVSEL